MEQQFTYNHRAGAAGSRPEPCCPCCMRWVTAAGLARPMTHGGKHRGCPPPHRPLGPAELWYVTPTFHHDTPHESREQLGFSC